jgi:hypothetical protein
VDRPDLPLLSLVFANGFTIALALIQDWELGTVHAIYWFQSVVIGALTFVRLLGTGGDGNRFARLALAGFFAFHYGLFHVVYLVFLVTFGLMGLFRIVDLPGLVLACALFLANHLVSFLWYRSREEVPSAQIFTEPYARIVPMHLTIIAGGFVTMMLPGEDGARLVLLLFLLLKTAADLGAHLKKHGGARTAMPPSPAAVRY